MIISKNNFAENEYTDLVYIRRDTKKVIIPSF